MNKFSYNRSGFTLVELLVSVGIIMIFLPFAASMLTNNQLLASYSKHRIQAANAAQQIIETQRQSPFVVLTQGQNKIIGPSAVLLDTKGNYNNITCGNANVFCGTSVITITPAVYAYNGVNQPASSTVDHIQVKIYWNEQVGKSIVPMTEYYAEDIANDPVLN